MVNRALLLEIAIKERIQPLNGVFMPANCLAHRNEDGRSLRQSQNIALSAALLPMLLEAGLSLAICGSILNAAGSRPESASLRKFAYFLPAPLPPVRLALLGSGFDLAPILSEIERFSSHLAIATRIARSELDEASCQQTGFLKEIVYVRDLWCGLAASAQLHILQLASLAGSDASGLAGGTLEKIQDLLSGVVNGGTPCLDSSGQIIAGDIGSRRRAPRFPVDMGVTVRHGADVQECRIRDVSSGGLGLDGIANIASGDSICIIVKGNRELDGTVAWVKGDQAGIRLGAELPVHDPLIAWAVSWQSEA